MREIWLKDPIYPGQYPHHLWEDDGSGGWNYVGTCREYTKGWSPTYNPTTGMFARHNSEVLMLPTTKTIPEGTKIMISDDESGAEYRVSGAVVKYDRGRMQNRLWI
jgi:hypothetical protein